MPDINLFFFCYILILDEQCKIKGQTGDGKKRGNCPELHLCQSTGKCKAYCRVVGKLGDGTQRGDCEAGMVCWEDGVCRTGKIIRQMKFNFKRV